MYQNIVFKHRLWVTTKSLSHSNPPSSYPLQLLQGNTKTLQSWMGDVIIPACPGSSLGCLPSGTHPSCKCSSRLIWLCRSCCSTEINSDLLPLSLIQYKTNTHSRNVILSEKRQVKMGKHREWVVTKKRESD